MGEFSENSKNKRKKLFDKFEEESLNTPQFILPVRNFFCEKQYIRETSVPAGITLTSEIHKTEHPFFLLKGKLLIGEQNSGKVVLIEAPFICITTPGTRRIVTALEDSVVATCHVTELTDIEAIGDEILEKTRNSGNQYKSKEAKKIHTTLKIG